MEIKEVTKELAYPILFENHYSPVMPRLTKHYLGCFHEGVMEGSITLGWGTQPRQTINKMFPGLGTESYYEIGKMAMQEHMPRNSESQMLSLTIKWMRENTQKDYLYTWADGIVGKPGYVYQAANFYYGGFIWTDIYIGPDGEKIHPRSSKELLVENARMLGKEKVFWLTPDFMVTKGIRRIKGKQFRYIMPLNKRAKRNLRKSPVDWFQDYPKHEDLQWKDATKGGKSVLLDERPEMDLSVINLNSKNVSQYHQVQNPLTELLGL